MILPDINVLLPALRPDLADHDASVDWLRSLHERGEPIALADSVIAGVIRISTDARVFHDPATIDDALTFAADLHDLENSVAVAAGARHWPILRTTVERGRAAGRLVPDAHLAALAIEHGCRIATRDRDFARFPGVEWFDPFEHPPE